MKKISGEICGAGHVVDSVNYIKIIWFSLIVSLLGLDLPSPDYLQAETVNRKGIIFYDDCEDAPNYITDWITNGLGGQNTLAVSDEQARAGSKSYKFTLAPYGTSGTNTNVELVLRGLAAGDMLRNFGWYKGQIFPEEYWIGWSFYVPSDFDFPDSDANPGCFGQFHAAPDDCDRDDLNPTAPIGLDRVTGGFSTIIIAEKDPCSDKINDRRAPYRSNSFRKGAWNDIVMNFKFDYRAENNPFFKIWLNGEQYVDDEGINSWNDSKGPFLKIGVYGHADVPMIIYYDEIRVGYATSDYASVAPGTSSTPPPSAPRGLTVK